MKRAWLLITIVVLAGCMPLYVPPVPNSENAMPNELRVVAVERTSDSELAVTARGSGELWLDAQWFAASGALLGSQSVWLELTGEAVTATFTNVAPHFSYLVFSAGGDVLRVYHNETGAP